MVLREIPMSKVLGFGSDGAFVMTGLDKGVTGRLKEHNPHILNVHCMVHRLALCTTQVAESIPALKKYQRWTTQLFYYFKASADREKEANKIQDILDLPILKYKEIHAVRWLSLYEALDAFFRTLDPLITYLHNRESTKDPKAKGLLKPLCTTQFLFITYLIMDVLQIVMRLCLIFQKKDLDVAKAKISLDLCLNDLEPYKEGAMMSEETYVKIFDTDVVMKEGHNEFKGHRVVASPGANLTSLKSTFVNVLVSNIRKMFPEKSLLDSFYVIAMRTYGNEEIEQLIKYYGQEKSHKATTSSHVLSKKLVQEQWSTAKHIVKSGVYPTDDMHTLWMLIITHHQDELEELI